MGFPAKKQAVTFTYDDYLTWPDTERWELIHGVAYDMSPAPSTEHQTILGELFGEFRNFLKGKPCQAYIAPFDVRLPEENEADEEIETVVQPDMVVICDQLKIDRRGCKGAPDLIIEIVSPSTAKKDTQDKFRLYERHGVKEYWIVYPGEHTIEVYILDKNGLYIGPRYYTEEDKLSVTLFPGLEIDLAEIFGIEKEKQP
jgi:Uma2 family endonuclease